MKKTLSVLLILSMILCVFCSCAEETTLIDSGKTIKIGVVQYENKEEYTQARNAFVAKMMEFEYADRLQIDSQFAEEDEKKLSSILDKFISNNVDVIVSIAPFATKTAIAHAKGEIPVIFAAVTNPISEHIMTSKSTPKGNVTGVTDSVSPDSIINYILGDLPGGLDNLGIIYNTSEVEHIMEINDFKDYMNTSAIPYVESIISNEFEGHKAASDLIYYIDPSTLPVISPYDGSAVYPNGDDVVIGVDAIYVSGDSVSKSSLKDVKDFLETEGARTVVYVADEEMLISPKFTTVKPVYRVIGRQAADMVDAYINGIPFDKLSCQDPLRYYQVNKELIETPNWIVETEDAFDRFESGEYEEETEETTEEENSGENSVESEE